MENKFTNSSKRIVTTKDGVSISTKEIVWTQTGFHVFDYHSVNFVTAEGSGEVSVLSRFHQG